MLVQRLEQGPMDVIGDVHGEIEALEALLHELGYDSDGHHPGGRIAVFVGDLVDRGPHSLATVERVRDMVAAGHARCVLGNHELNVLRQERKEGNDWFFDATGPANRERVLEFFAGLPIALERADLRVVHACWHDEHISRLRSQDGSVVEISQTFVDDIDRRLEVDGIIDRARAEASVPTNDRSSEPPMLHARAERNVRRQVEHPIKVLTSGLEEVSDEPFWAGGSWRFERRVPWWNTYDGPMVIVGHYWRSQRTDSYQGKGPDLFAGTDPTAPLGPAGRVMCVDYSIGHRDKERRAGTSPFRSALAAYRWPERQLVFSPA